MLPRESINENWYFLQVGTFALLFAAIICFLRLDLSITRDAKWLAAQKLEGAGAALQRLVLLIDGELPRQQVP